MPITTGNVAKLLYPGLDRIYGHAYNEKPLQRGMIYETVKSRRAFEESVGMTGFGLLAVKTEGNAIGYDTEQQGFLTRFNHLTYASGFTISEEAIDDDLYSVVGERRTKGLAFSARQTQETVGANVLNRAFNTSYVGGDAATLIASAGGGGSASHPNVSGGTWTNGPSTASDLSEAALEQAKIDIDAFTDDRGKLISVGVKQLIIPSELQFEAERILESRLQSGTANNDINALYTMGVIPKVVVNDYLTDADAWFVQTDIPNGMIHYERKPMMFASDDDFDTSNVKFKVSYRESLGWIDPRCMWGSPGA